MKRRGSALVAVLLLLSLLLLLGLALVSQSSSSAQAATQRARSTQARGLALAGLNEARAKLAKDQFFPPAGGQGQDVFVYSESVVDFDGQLLGCYRVSVDRGWAEAPVKVMHLESEGLVGPPEQPLARRKLSMDLDFSPLRDPFKVLRFVDEGVP